MGVGPMSAPPGRIVFVYAMVSGLPPRAYNVGPFGASLRISVRVNHECNDSASHNTRRLEAHQIHASVLRHARHTQMLRNLPASQRVSASTGLLQPIPAHLFCTRSRPDTDGPRIGVPSAWVKLRISSMASGVSLTGSTSGSEEQPIKQLTKTTKTNKRDTRASKFKNKGPPERCGWTLNG